MKLDKHSNLNRRQSLIALGWLSNILLLISLIMPTLSAVEMIRGLGGNADVGNLAMGRNDDGSSAIKMLGAGFPHGINFFGNTYDSLYINNNGNVTFNGRVGGYTPRSFPTSSRPMIAPYWGDVDTRSRNVPDPTQNNVYYSALENKFIVTWFYVGYYSYATSKLNAFQLILTDRSEIAPGDFDVEFRYEQLEWTTGNASGGSGGLGGVPAQVGFDAGDRTNFFKHPDSMTAMVLNLINSSNVGEDGVWRFEIRSGVIIEPNNMLSDVNVTVKLPVTNLDIELTSFVTEPLSISTVNGETLVKWHFETFSADQVKDLGFDINLRNPVPGEKRIISYVLELSYLDINGKPVYTELEPQTVTVLPSVYQLSVNTDKTSYSVAESVDINYTINNLSSFSQEAVLQLSVRDANNNLVADLGTQKVTLAAETNLVLAEPDFFTSTLYEGKYHILMEMIEDGQTINAATTTFDIVSPTLSKVAATITTNKPVYNPLETVYIQNRIKNQVPNAIVENMTAITTIYAPDNSIFWTNNKAIPQLLPQQFQDQNHTVTLGRALPGTYKISLLIQDAQAIEKARSTTNIEVQSTAATGFGLIGKINATPTMVFKSESISLNAQVENIGNAIVENLPIVLSIIDPQAEQIITQWTETIPSLIIDGQYYLAQNLQAWGDVGKTYVATLGIQQANGQIKILATTFFIIVEKIKSSLQQGTKGRLLILLDSQTPPGPKTAPTLSEQRAFLETLLDSQAWTYTIVTNEEAFTQELRSGGYLVYLLLSEHEKLAEQVQKELREAVYRGEALIVAGANDQRHHFDEVLGIKHKGKSPKADGFIFNDNGESLTTYFAFSDKVLRAELAGALSTGQFLNTTDLAASFHNYGEGKSIYIGFDLLAQATALGEDNPLAAMLTTALTTVHPEVFQPTIGKMIPIDLSLTNQGTTTPPGQVIIDLPEGMTFIAPDEVLFDERNSRLIWPFDLQQEPNSVLTFWLHLPWFTGEVPINALIQIGTAPNFQDYGNITLVIDVEENPAIAKAYDLLNSLQYEDQVYAKAFKHLQKAVKFIETGINYKHVLKELVQAADELSKSQEVDAHRLRVMVSNAIRNVAGIAAITQ